MSSNPRIYVHPGYIYRSRERRYIDAATLAELHGVDLDECQVVTDKNRRIGEIVPIGAMPQPSDIHLIPRIAGDY